GCYEDLLAANGRLAIDIPDVAAVAHVRSIDIIADANDAAGVGDVSPSSSTYERVKGTDGDELPGIASHSHVSVAGSGVCERAITDGCVIMARELRPPVARERIISDSGVAVAVDVSKKRVRTYAGVLVAVAVVCKRYRADSRVVVTRADEIGVRVVGSKRG